MRTLYTHASIFHADEVIGAGLLIHLGEIPGVDAVCRVNEPPAAPQPGDIVLDLGLKLGPDEAGVLWLDHHQDKALPCAAVLVFRHFEARWSKPERKAIERFLDGVDKHDRGLVPHQSGTMTISDIVAALNPVGEVGEAERLAAFREAVRVFLTFFQKMVAFQVLVEAQSAVVAALVAKNAPWVGSDTFLPKLVRALEGGATRFCAYPSLRGGWCLQAVSQPGTKTPVQAIPPDTAGATFVHPAGFIAAFPTREAAEAAAEALCALPLPEPVAAKAPEAEITD